MDNSERFNSAMYGISDRISKYLMLLPENIKNNVQEIRIRNSLPVALTVAGQTLFVLEDGQTSRYITRSLLKAEKSDLEESFKRLCQSSVYAHSEELKNGYIMMKNGHRAGICGTLSENGVMRDVTSVNIRIAREIFGVADEIVRQYNGGGILIAGPPGCGKTTILRDMIRQLSSGFADHVYRVAVIDSRGELSGSSDGRVYNDLGLNSDVLLCTDKASGIEIAVRTMSPDIVAFDEIGTAGELQRVSEGFCCGVNVITTAHIGSETELMKRSVTSELIKSTAISKIVLLPPCLGSRFKIMDAKELLCVVC